ncbi:hypothetical protein DB30_03397 [Enhygromyxa salina]|uniref:N-acetylmuramoyl-L-alanine amidase n=1 Tax=Enhygromyxa salina TaxID=215803 RepID=A0A0C2D6R4_9BACT|nr:N-acetylmuramoyl-L-alanine amidase [Enhygromyxa salina]KIG17340.1 hypothetical protein DB30_03397 [Enhygromyxa salina]
MKKNPTSTAKNAGTEVEWFMRFWLPGAFKGRWSTHQNAPIRQVTCRIMEPPNAPNSDKMIEHWRQDEIDGSTANIQPGLDRLKPGRLYLLELDVPADSMYRSAGPAGPDTGRAEVNTLPPRIHPSDNFDYQVRPARFWFEVEDAPEASPTAKRISAMHDEEYEQTRPPPARHQLLPTGTGVTNVEVDWRPDWLRRGRKDNDIHIRPAGSNEMKDGRPTHIVLHSIGIPQLDNVSNIGAAFIEFFEKTGNGGVHYIVDADGHVVKMCPESRALHHADTAFWRGTKSINSHAIGIEHGWSSPPDANPKQQMRAVRNLLQALKAAFGIDGRNIAGHGEVRCIGESEASLSTALYTAPANRTQEQKELVKRIEDKKRDALVARNDHYREKGQTSKILTDAQIAQKVAAHLRSAKLSYEYDFSWGLALHPSARLVTCPGPYFGWAYLAARGVVPDPTLVELPDDWHQSAYSGIFGHSEAISLRIGDNDLAQVWNGKPQPDILGSPILELHEDLRFIGYTIPTDPTQANGSGHVFSKMLEMAIKAFRTRYMQDPRPKITTKPAYGQVDKATAAMVRRVRLAYEESV